MSNRHPVIFKCREKMGIKTYEFKTRNNALNYFRLFYEPDSEALYYSINISEFDVHQKVEHLFALLTFVEESINGNTVRKDWRNWNVGRVVVYEIRELDGDSITQRIIAEIYSDYAILTADDMYLWIDDDT